MTSLQNRFTSLAGLVLLFACGETVRTRIVPGQVASADPEATEPAPVLPSPSVVVDTDKDPIKETMADASTPAPRRGAVFAVSEAIGRTPKHRAGAYFVEGSAERRATPDRVVGPCVVQTYGQKDTPAEEVDVAAGEITMTFAERTLTFKPRSDATYASVSGVGTLWSGGEEVKLRIAGGSGGPSFDAKAKAPHVARLSLPLTALATIDRNAPPTLAWTGGGEGSMIAYFDSAGADSATAVTCTFSASAGEGAIPAAAFETIAAGGGTFALYTLQRTPLAEREWSVVWNMSSIALDGEGAPAEGATVFR